MGARLHGWLCVVIGCLAVVACSIDKVRYTAADDDDDGGRTTAMVSIQLTGSGHGTIVAQGADLVCGTTCTATVPLNKTITLLAMPEVGASFGGWTGAGCDTEPTCTVTASDDIAIGAVFDVRLRTIDVELLGSGMGIVMSSTGGLVCPGNCTMQVPHGAQVSFSAAPTTSSVFVAWSGACGGTACMLTAVEDLHIGATFAKQHELVVKKDGNGIGTVTAPGIDCGDDCSEAYPMGAMIDLAAVAGTDSVFMGWSGGGCSGIGACTVKVDAATEVTATFAKLKRLLTVQKEGAGKGAVTGAGIDCGDDCSEYYDIHTAVTLMAAADSNSNFEGWSGGGCSGAGSCTVKLDDAVTVKATFAVKPSAGQLLVSDHAGPRISTFASSTNGTPTTIRQISGALTTLSTPRGITMFNNEIFVVDESAAAIVVFALTADGNVAPVRRIQGAKTNMQNPFNAVIYNGEIYSSQYGNSRIVVFPLTADGDVAPSRILTGFSSNTYMTINDGQIYLSDYGTGRVLVFPANAPSGTIAPTRIISNVGGPTGIFVYGEELFVSDWSNGRIVVYAKTASGAATPLRVISGALTQLTNGDQLVVHANEIYVASLNVGRVVVFSIGASGNVAPARQILQSSPFGVWAF